MARPQRNNVDYFPHECVHGRKMFVIENKYGNDGYAVWFKLLEQLGDAENHYLDLRQETQTMYLSSVMKVSEEKFKSILLDLAKLNAIHTELYIQHSIIWSDKFIESVQDAYARRNNKCITFEGLCKHLSVKLEHKPSKSNVTVSEKPQRIVKDSKGNKSKGNNTGEFVPPSFEEFEKHCKEKGFSKIARQAFDGYALNNWHDANNAPISNWKSKLNNGWFSEKNKDPEIKILTGRSNQIVANNSNPYDALR